MLRSYFTFLTILPLLAACTDRTRDAPAPAVTAASSSQQVQYSPADAMADIDKSFSDVTHYDFKGAKLALIRARSLLPKNPLLLHNLAILYTIDNDPLAAKRALNDALKNVGDYEVKPTIFIYNSDKLGSSVVFYQNAARISPPDEAIAIEPKGQFFLIAKGSGVLQNLTTKDQKGTITSIRLEPGIVRSQLELKHWLDKISGDAPHAFKEGINNLAKTLPSDWNFSTVSVDVNRQANQGAPQVTIVVDYDRQDISKIYGAVKLTFAMVRQGRTSESDFAKIPSEFKGMPASLGAGFVESVGRLLGYTAAEMKDDALGSWQYRIVVQDSSSHPIGSLVVAHADVMDLVNGKISASEQLRMAKIYNFK